MFVTVLHATLRLLLFRAGPQDFPYDPGLSRWLVPLGVAANALVFGTVLPPPMALAMGAAMIGGLHLCTRSLLRLRKLEARYTQTFHALVASGSVLTLALLPAMLQVAPLLVELASREQPLPPGTRLELPAGPALMMNVLNLWAFAVNAAIYRQAADFKLPLALLATLLIAMTLLMFVVFGGFLAAALLGA